MTHSKPGIWPWESGSEVSALNLVTVLLLSKLYRMFFPRQEILFLRTVFRGRRGWVPWHWPQRGYCVQTATSSVQADRAHLPLPS